MRDPIQESMRARFYFVLCTLACLVPEGSGHGARTSASVAITNPHDFSISDPSFPLSFTVFGGDALEEGTMAVALLNNREVINITLNGTAQQSVTIEVNELAQMTYDLTVILQGSAGNYLGVCNVTSFGVIGGSQQPPLDEAGKETIWTKEEITERMRRRKTIDEHMLEHAQDMMTSSAGQLVDAQTVCSDFFADDNAVMTFVGLLLAFEGRPADAAACLPSANQAVPLPSHFLSPASGPLFASPSLFAGAVSRIDAIVDLHQQLYDAMRAASPGDPAMGMEGTSGQLELQTQLYHVLAQSPRLRTFCETGFGAGHSTLNWLASNPDATVVAFDLGSLRGADVGEAFVAAKFPGRFQLIRGDSSWTVPDYVEAHPELRCDVVHVDGGHFDFVPWNDLIELARASHSQTVVLVDDTPSIGDVARAMEVARQTWILHEIGCWNTVGYDSNTRGRHLRGFCLGFYDAVALEAIKAYGA